MSFDGVLRFRLLGFPVEIRPGFWLLGGLVGWGAEQSLGGVLQLTGVLFLAVMVHELGHAALARVFGQEPKIRLHALGGLTYWHSLARLDRWRQVAISLAGPGAGLVGGLLGYVLFRATAEGSLAQQLLFWWVGVSFALTAINMLPVLPFDGGQAMAAALGVGREKQATAVSMIFGALIAMHFARTGLGAGAIIFASAALFNLMAYLRAPAAPPSARVLGEALDRARAALRAEAYPQAGAIATAVLDATEDGSVRREALEIIAWSALTLGRPELAGRALGSVPTPQQPEVEAYLRGAVAEANGQLEEAASVLTRARADGDGRPELAGLLVRTLLRAERYEEGAQLTEEILEDTSLEDARRVASAVREGRAFLASASLWSALFERSAEAPDAYAAAQSYALGGKLEAALRALGSALGAGYTDIDGARNDASFKELAGDQRFEAVLAVVGHRGEG